MRPSRARAVHGQLIICTKGSAHPLSLSPRNKIAHSRVNEVNDVNGVNDVNDVNDVIDVNDVNNVNDIHDADEELLRKIVYKILENGRI